ncbi:putative D-arabinitol 2-dehydrogenase [Bisporella sp. PMI_857]|nr:putative D-arabinitol 2-dehydrogenase [Bisporella sp. PMI_857]
MFARSLLRVSARASRVAVPVAPKVPRATFVGITKHRQADPLIPQSEIPASTYAGGEVQRSTIAVGGAQQQIEEDRVTVTPLTKAVFDKMPLSMQKLTLFGKVVIITGGARGLGNYMARACIEAGARAIAIFDANQELGDASAAELHELTGNTIPIEFAKVDVRDGKAIEDAVAMVVEKYGAPDVLINSAGIADSNIPAETYDHTMFRRLIDINLTGSFLMSQAVGKAMMAAGKPGSIILVASMSGSIVNYPNEQSCYNASKAGVVHLGKSLGAEWAKYNIRVNCISPGYMDTALNNVPALDAQKTIWKSLTPQQRLGAIDDLNGLAVFLGSDSAAFMTGSNVLIDGGYTLY